MALNVSREELEKAANAAEPYGPEELAFDDPNIDHARMKATLAAIALGRIKPE